jgi:Co/Zn/Cd efflux system component
VAHFFWCRHPATCFCEVNRFLSATVCGLFFASAQFWLANRYAGSYGAEGDAGHMFADSLFMFVSVFLAVWKHYDHSRTNLAEPIGIIANTIFLFGTALAILYHTYFGDEFTHFSIGWMAIAGMIGLIGNLVQYRILEDPAGGDMSSVSLHSMLKQHVVYDILNSIAVIAGAAISLIVANPRPIDKGLATLLAMAMMWTCYKNMKGVFTAHSHHHH